ncbi:MAG TPA: SMP-30/gluconolactonase/LRE family protein [Candidatus Angelobacter sp.]|nr:SMP-30/gluconolactonase/LRE family protein [Candidatus Angelobacter sp.]
MGITESLLGRKSSDGNPYIEAIDPPASLPGGEVRIIGRALKPPQLARPEVEFNGTDGSIVVSSENFVIARVPYGAHSGEVKVHSNGHISNGRELKIGQPIAESLHPVANPAVDHDGNIYVTYSGGRGQKVPVAIYKIDTDYNVKPFLADLMNATGMAFDSQGELYVSSRYDGTVYRVAQNGTLSTYAEGMGVATGIAFDREGSLYVGDRGGTIWRIAPDRQIFVYATLEPSVAAYHLAFGPDGKTLYVTGPTTSSFDAVYSVDSHGTVQVFYRGLGRPQGLAFDAQGNLYVAASLSGRRGIVRITPEKQASLVIAGHDLIGLAFTHTGNVVLVTKNSVFHLTWGIQGLPLI